MGKLQHQIKELELEIASNQAELRANAMMLHKKMQTSQFLCFAIVGGFGAGFILGSKFDKEAAKEHITQAPSRLLKFYDHIKIFLPLLSI